MVKARTLAAMALAAVMAAGWFSVAISQDKAPDDKGDKADRKEGDRGRGDRGQRSPEEWKKRMEEWKTERSNRMKEALGANDDEWKVLQPKIEKVNAARMSGMGGFGGFGGFMRGRGGPGGGENADQQQSPIQKASGDLRKVLDNKEAKAEEIKAALDALRAARAKARQDIEAAQKELKELVTVRQEAVLVSQGILE